MTQATQTTIDTQTFINILNINLQRAGTASVATQAIRYQGDLSYLTKRYGIHKFDFGQTVAPEQIQREFALFEIELKSKRIFAGQPRGGTSLERQQQDKLQHKSPGGYMGSQVPIVVTKPPVSITGGGLLTKALNIGNN